MTTADGDAPEPARTRATSAAELGPRSVLVAIVWAIVLCAGFHLAFGNQNLNLRDEGYLWYGVDRVLASEVPLRDFQAYDPGRYYWCAAFTPLFGDSIVGVRAGVAAFEALGIVCGLLVARRFLKGDAWLLPVGLLLLLWMFPRHKLFEPALTMIAAWSLTRLLERPTVRRHLVFGLVVGLAAVFGRNHGLYLAIVAGLASLWLRLRAPERPSARALVAGAGGIALGFAPVLAMVAFVPGFAAAFWEAIVSVTDRGANIPLGYRWPWQANEEASTLGGLALDLAYLLPLLALPAGFALAWLRGRRVTPALVASAFVGAVYVHHYAVRADLPHLAQAYPPVLLTVLGLAHAAGLRSLSKGALLAVLLVAALFTAFEGHTELKPFAPGAEPQERVELEVRRDRLDLKRNQAGLVHGVQTAVARHVGDEELFIAPTMPMWYPLLEKRAPTWWIYYLWPATDEEQRVTLERLADVRWALIIDRPFNDLPEYGFPHTNPLVWQEIQRSWERVNDPALPLAYALYRRRDR